MHNYWLQYRYTMDDTMLRDRSFPMLKRSTNYYLHLLKEGPTASSTSPAATAPNTRPAENPNPDCNIDLALLRWGCSRSRDPASA
jgi:alpha-L-fucosidase 2